MSKMGKKMVVTRFVSEVKHVDNYTCTLILKNPHTSSVWSTGIYSENIEGESTEANDLIHIL